MQYQVSNNAAADVQASCIVVTLDQSGKLSDAAQAINSASNGFLQARVEAGDISGKLAETLLLPGVAGISAARVLLVGTGVEAESSDKALSTTSAIKVLDAIASATSKQSGSVAVSLAHLADNTLNEAWWAEQTAMAFGRAQYRFTATKPVTETKAEEQPKQADTLIWLGDDVSSSLEKGEAVAQGVNYARDLGNLPGNICTPSYLAEEAEKLAADNANVETIIIDEDQMEAMGAGAFVSVAKGSIEPGKLIIMKYQGADNADEAPHMILGKGITFDTGGISLKPGAKMDEMKYDMCGAASVLGAMQAMVALQPKQNIIGMITSAENMPAGHASKPGDVVTSLSGKTIEILNTDAEGRLVLCDALTYGINHFKPASIVDIATLTGACMAALGGVNSGLFTQDESLADELQSAARYSNDKVWRLPLEDDYQELLDTNFADMANIGGPLAGATTAACFLARFTEGTPWAHLDIAGTAWGGAGKSKGASGRPVPLLVNYLLAK
ncbi:leucyl aminopeptidase [Bacterioplanoides sp. SCSIO 12839]|uniref:leucyl aminopeptidase n=1 Tax=Bacterioplanoides sp. SCSIO 12839 TaxID=2829569 RepID=UPI0021043848|nr:leucyl aminopeptidase [Bacterioplanoides sp. SCSIO 12839]UTW47008.1 leucyl aminopeptidase [Bacterioplanoides sp. SCSIO 12839]